MVKKKKLLLLRIIFRLRARVLKVPHLFFACGETPATFFSPTTKNIYALQSMCSARVVCYARDFVENIALQVQQRGT